LGIRNGPDRGMIWMKEGNLFSGIPDGAGEEVFTTLLKTGAFTLERIVSSGQATPPGQWWDQETHEWVILLKGRAGLMFEGEEEGRTLQPGDFVLIPAHRKHRVEWTDAVQTTLWLALHYRE
jgi:cupin 2 domain-containing protein